MSSRKTAVKRYSSISSTRGGPPTTSSTSVIPSIWKGTRLDCERAAHGSTQRRRRGAAAADVVTALRAGLERGRSGHGRARGCERGADRHLGAVRRDPDSTTERGSAEEFFGL